MEAVIRGIRFVRRRPTKAHRIAIWENMLGTVFASDNEGKAKYFDYDYAGARRYCGIDYAEDIRIYRYDGRPVGIPKSIRPSKGQLVVWVK